MLVVCAEDLQRLARDRVNAEAWDFIEGGSGAELSLAGNRAAFDHTSIRPRVLVDVSTCDSRVEMLGMALDTPIGLAPIAYNRVAHPEGELAAARAAAAANALFVVSMFASQTIEEIAAASTVASGGIGPLWLQIYWLRERSAVEDVARRAAAAGYRGLMLTVDAPRIGRRLRDIRRGFAIPADIRAVNIAPELMASAHDRRPGESAMLVHATQTFDQTITWDDLAWLRGLTDLPLIVKGIMTAEDAKLALSHGVDAIVVSNHGGRQLDGTVPTLLALPEVVAAVDGQIPVLVDGGVRSGRDVFVALALGATAVLVGRPLMWALAVDGERGVLRLLELLTDELTHTMALAGRPRLSTIGRDAVALSNEPIR